MLCERCSYQLREGASFCPNCGALLDGSLVEAAPEPRTCIVQHMYRVMDDLLTVEHWFVAREEGASAAYDLGESPRWADSVRFLGKGNKNATWALRQLVTALRANGWEYFGRRMQWYALRFRRSKGAPP